jgi:predicted nucleotidyltransferase component of viral defense system
MEITDKEKRLLHIFIKNIINKKFKNIHNLLDILNIIRPNKIGFIQDLFHNFYNLKIIKNEENFSKILNILNKYCLNTNFYDLYDIYLCIDYYCLQINNSNYFNIVYLLHNIYNEKNYKNIIINFCENNKFDRLNKYNNISYINIYELFNYNEIQKYLLENNYDN